MPPQTLQMPPPPRPVPPPLSDAPAWHKIITNGEIRDFRKEDVLLVFDARDATCDEAARTFILDYFIYEIDALLRRRFRHDEPAFANECRDEARSHAFEAILDPKVKQATSLRKYFDRTVVYMMMHAKTDLSTSHHRLPVPQKLEWAPDEPFETEEAKAIQKMDRDKARARLSARSPIRERDPCWPSFGLLPLGMSQKEIAKEVGLSERHLLRKLNKIIEILAEPDAE